jgi:hypothetical protein
LTAATWKVNAASEVLVVVIHSPRGIVVVKIFETTSTAKLKQPTGKLAVVYSSSEYYKRLVGVSI